MRPSIEWLEKYEEVKEKSVSTIDFNNYFEMSEICGKKISVMEIGECSLPSGEVVVCDPLVYLGYNQTMPYFKSVPKGNYLTEVCVIEPVDFDCARYACVRLRFNDKKAVKFYEAMCGNEDLDELENSGDVFFGFGVDAGLGCICDEETRKLYCEWEEEWYKTHEGDNLYDHYFVELFEESYKNNPKFQRSGGDWINWTIPGTEYHIPMFQSGFGDGAYPVYFGVDEDGEVCQLVVSFINIELDYDEEEE